MTDLNKMFTERTRLDLEATDALRHLSNLPASDPRFVGSLANWNDLIERRNQLERQIAEVIEAKRRALNAIRRKRERESNAKAR